MISNRCKHFCSKFVYGLTLLFLSNQLIAEPEEQLDQLMDLSFSELLNVRVTTPTKTSHETWLAPSSVTVISAQQIQNYGYRTVWDALQTVVGALPAYDGNSAQLSFRGALEPGSFGNRFIMMINGHKVSHSYFQWTSVNESLGLSIDNVKHIEVVRGAGSVMYGSNAFDAVINVVTRKPQSLDGFELITKLGASTNNTSASPLKADNSINQIVTSLSYATTHKDGASTLVSITRNQSDGHKLWIPYFQDTAEGGIANEVDDKLGEFFWLQHQREDFNLSLQFSEVDFGRPLAPFFATPNSDMTRNNVRKYYAQLEHQYAVDNSWQIESRLYHDNNTFDGTWYYQGFSPLDRQLVPSKLSGFETIQTYTTRNNELVIGIQYEHHKTSQTEDYPSEAGFFRFDSYQFEQRSLYAQNQLSFLDNQLLWNLSARYENNSDFGSVSIKRSSLVFQASDSVAFRFHLGEAYRAPLLHDFFYQSSILNVQQSQIEKLGFEKTHSVEIGFNKRSDHYQFDLIYYRDDDKRVVKYNSTNDHYFNAEGDVSKGLEMVFDYHLSSELSGYFNLAHVDTPKDSDGEKFNSPRYSLKMGAVYQLLAENQLVLAIEGQHYADQDYVDHPARVGVDLNQPAYSLFNLNLRSNNNPWDMSMSLRINNLFNRAYEYPVFKGTRQGYPSLGRSVLMTISKTF
jgi:outer membrane receptor for ferrienterochelin and colicins